MQKILIEYCTSNTDHGTDVVMARLGSNEAYDVIEYGCLGNCGECYLNPFAMVEGEIVATDTIEQLYDAILQEIDKQRADREALDKLLDNL